MFATGFLDFFDFISVPVMFDHASGGSWDRWDLHWLVVRAARGLDGQW